MTPAAAQERFKHVADQLCYELHRQSSRLRELELENARPGKEGAVT